MKKAVALAKTHWIEALTLVIGIVLLLLVASGNVSGQPPAGPQTRMKAVTQYRQVCNGNSCSLIPYTTMVPQAVHQSYGSAAEFVSVTRSVDQGEPITITVTQPVAVTTDPGGDGTSARPGLLGFGFLQMIHGNMQKRQENRQSRRQARRGGCGD